MTSEQWAAVHKLVDFLQADTLKAGNTASRKETSRRTWDALTTLLREYEQLKDRLSKYGEVHNGQRD